MKASSILHYWRPSNEIGEVLGFERFEYTFNKVKLIYQIIKNGKLIDKYVCFTFNDGVLSMRFSDEGHRSELNDFTFSDPLNPTSSERGVLWPLYKMEDSEFLDWYISKDLGPGFGSEITDFVFVDQENVLEVLSSYDPVVTIHDSLDEI
jgi:hypothetical protein